MLRISPLALAGAVIATSLTILSTAPAQAAVRHVRYADLDLNSVAGRTAIQQRIRTAANAVCHIENRDLGLAFACATDTIAQAQTDLRHATGTALIQVASR